MEHTTDHGWGPDSSEISELPPLPCLYETAESSTNMGNHPGVDWDRFYDILDTQHGYDMQDLGGTTDNRIRRIVRQAITDGEIG